MGNQKARWDFEVDRSPVTEPDLSGVRASLNPANGGSVSTIASDSVLFYFEIPVPHESYQRGLDYSLLGIETANSYPSGNATRVAFFGTIAWLQAERSRGKVKWAVRGAIVMLEIVLGIERVYREVHWPSDVVGGWLLGLGVGVFASTLLVGDRPEVGRTGHHSAEGLR